MKNKKSGRRTKGESIDHILSHEEVQQMLALHLREFLTMVPLAYAVLRRRLRRNDLGAASKVLEFSRGWMEIQWDVLAKSHPTSVDPDFNPALYLMVKTITETAEAFGRELPPELEKLRRQMIRKNGRESKG